MAEEKEPLTDGLRKLPKSGKTSFKRTAVILGLAAALLVAVVLILVFTGKKAPEKPTDEYVINLEKECNRVVVNQFDSGVRLADESFTLINKEDKWLLEGDEDKSLDQEAVKNITESTVLRASRIIDANPSEAKLREFGLFSPHRTLRFELAGEDNFTLSIGGRVTADGGFYARVSGKKNVYLISDVEGEWLTSTKSELMALPAIVPPEAQGSVDKMTIKTPSGSFVIQRAEELGNNYNYWRYTSPVSALCDDNTVGEFVSAAAAIKPDEFAGSRRKDEFGLQHPSLVIVFSAFGNSYGMEVGNETEDNYRYCSVNNGDVFKISADKLTAIEQFNGMTLLQTNITKYHINVTDRIRIFDGSGDLADIKVRHVPSKKDGKDVLSSQCVLNGKVIDPEVFSRFYVSFLDARYDGVLPKGYTPGKSVLGYELILKDNTRVKVEFLERDAYSKAVRVNGTTYYYILNKQVNVMREKLDLLLMGKLEG